MDLKALVSLGLLAILGFLLYPRGGEQSMPTVENQWIQVKNVLDDEPLHGAKLRKDNPIVKTYDLGYIYKIDSAEIIFSGSPKDYDILASPVRNAPKYDRVASALSTSKEYYYPVISFPSKEARWVQVVVNDWYQTRPEVESTKIGARYQRYSPVKGIRVKYNQGEAFRLIDGLKQESAPKWFGGRKVEIEVDKQKKVVKEVTYEPPGHDGVDIIFDLGTTKRIYGVAVTTGGDENNLKQYEISTSLDSRDFQRVYVSGRLENETITDSHSFTSRRTRGFEDKTLAEPLQARYVRLRVGPGGWYGKYPEIREVEIYTDEYRPSEYSAYAPEPIEDYNAIQVYYDNCGMDGNVQAPDVIQGFPFDQGEDFDSSEVPSFRPKHRGMGDSPRRYFLKPDEEVDAGNSPSERSFCYHYDRVILRYSNLEPEAVYWVQVTYLQERKGKRIQSLDVDGFLLHDGMEIPTNSAKKLTFAIPPEAYADGEMELHFNRLAGPNAVVSEAAILRASKGEMLAGAQSKVPGLIAKAPMAAIPVVIDGALDEWPSLFPLVPQQYSDDPLDSPCQMYVQWDSDNLFIAFRAKRGNVGSPRRVTSASAFMQSPDALHVFVDASLARSPGMYKTGDHHFRFLPLGVSSRQLPAYAGTAREVLAAQIHHHLDAIPRTIEDNKEIEVATRIGTRDQSLGNRGTLIPDDYSLTPNEYVLEARIPKDKALYGFSPQSGTVIGFNYILSNPYSSVLFWSAPSDAASPASWGKLELVGTVSGQLAIMDRGLTSKLTDFSAGETLVLAVWDPDRNTDRNSPQSIKIRISGDLTKDSREVTLYETTQAMAKSIERRAENEEQEALSSMPLADNSDLFAGKLSTEFGASPSEDPLTLAVQGKERVTLHYLDPYYGPNETDVEVTVSATVRVGTTGTVQIENQFGEQIENFNAGDTLFFRVEDGDPVGESQEARRRGDEYALPRVHASMRPPSVTVTSSEDTEEVTLVETTHASPVHEKHSGVFIGSIETMYKTEGAADGILQVVGYETIKVTYLDSIQATGNTNVPVEARAIVNIGSTGIISILDAGKPVTSDALRVTGFNAGDDILILLRDADVNTDGAVIEHIDVKVEGDAVMDSVVLTLTETEPGSGTFSSLLSTAYGLIADKSNEILEIKGNEAVTITYKDALQATGATGVAVSETVFVNVGNDGIVSLLRSNYFWDLENFNAGDTLYFRVEDADLNIDPEVRDRVDISVVSEMTTPRVRGDHETVTLEEKNPNAGVFFGSLRTKYSMDSVAPDNILQVQGNEKVTATYLDGLRVTGETNVPVTDSCKVNVGTTGRITVYSRANPYAPIAGFPDQGWENRFRAGDTLSIRLEDVDLNVTSAAAEIFQVSTTEDVIRDSVPVTLTEAAGSAGVFTGEVETEYGVEAVPGDDILQVQGEGRVNIFYIDAITDTGETNVPIAASLTVKTGQIGTIQALEAVGEGFIPSRTITSFSAGDAFIVRVRDGDLNIDPEVIDRAAIIARGNLLEDQLQIVLQETDVNSGIFDGRAQSIHASQADLYDTVLQVKEKEVLLLTYIDEVGVTGETDVPVSIELVVRGGIAGSLLIVDENWRELPNFSAGRKLYLRLDDFVLSNTSPNAVPRITVKGNETRDTEEVLLEKQGLEKGIYTGSISTSYGATPVQDGILQVRGGEEIKAIYYPQTPGAPSQPIIDTTYTNKGTTGKITITGVNGLRLTNFNAGDTLYFRLEDTDLNMDLLAIDTADIWVAGDAIASGRTVTLAETSEDSSTFTGSIDTRYGRAVFGSPSILEVIGGEQVTAVYYDALTSSGETDLKITDSCRANMLGTGTYTSEGVVIDGNMAGWPLENALRAGDEGSNLYVQWDRNNLYILAYVVDSDVVVPDATQFWDGADALEIHIDTDPTGEISSYLHGLKKPSSYFFWFCPKGAGPDGNRPYVGQNMPETVYDYTAIETAVRIFPGSRYVLEARIPFDPVLGGFDPYKTSEDDRVGFNYIIRRSNAAQLRWALGSSDSATREPDLPPSFFGTLILKQP